MNLLSSEQHYLRIQRIHALTLRGARRAWSRMDLADLEGSWQFVAPQLVAVLSAAQLAAARSAVQYVPEAAREQNIVADPVAVVEPRGFAGTASDGRDLSGLLYGAVVASRVSNDLARGSAFLDTVLPTQVADAGRAATSVGQYTRPKLTHYTRMLNPPSCSRCAVLAGRVYVNNSGFQRHPRCDCVHVPTREDVAGDLTTDPRAYFDSLNPKQQAAIFTKSGAQAIRDGADMNQVVNARRGMYTAQAGGQKVLATREGTTRRGYARTAPGSTVGKRGIRLMPETIYQVATSRDDALRLLRANGYIR